MELKENFNIETNAAVPELATMTPTILSSDKSERIAEIKSTINRRMADRPFMGADGFPRYADGSINYSIKPLNQQ